MNYYKMVEHDLSSVIPHLYSITYRLGEWISPSLEGSLLFVFDDLRAAQNYAASVSLTTRLFKCEIEKGKNLRDYVLSVKGLKNYQAKEYWRTTPFPSPWITLPIYCTVFAKKVKLIEELKVEKY